MSDEVALWQETQARVGGLVRAVEQEDPAALRRPVPACPDWSGRDLLAHMVGLGADVLAGDEPDDHNPSWTQAQVDARAGRDGAALVDEWDDLAPRLADWMRAHGTRPLGDVVIHEQDLRGALGRPGGRDSGGFAAIRDRMTGRLATRWAEHGGGRTLGLVADDDGWTWCSADVDPSGADVVLRASGFDLGRAVVARRTATQLRGWVVCGELGDGVQAFAVLGPLPEQPLPE
ncbi:maleylpyruvate isomerase family mycothiol-dependent enzyme [Lapillicoccus jejuensis]|uniref:Uncharacterized protein (TIGR03083 family) n=1 Tax=Lapillicoccus jejuensis TaxID=402171 RepID=A0A542E1S6_9MICO|nr:maleylpyruvate isomerase family mycothiol-dependent enzyme [Lapillicoccus jejuensis]TQJ09292.1 uncharacterized protein (TIGR03083 family) [Lapillicoccus jejuensis]